MARYNVLTNSNRVGSYELARDVAVDAAGNVYVTGLSVVGNSQAGLDYVTVKYAPTGQQLWAARYNGPTNNQDEARALAVDAAGNAYVTGITTRAAGNTDYATVKYSPTGQQLWVAYYDGPANGSEQAWAIAVDAGGNVYVTGDSAGAGTSGDYATVKYSASGQQLWAARYNGPTSGGDYAQALGLDAAGNVFVTGISYRDDNSTSGDFATVKYAPTGEQLWAAVYNSPANGYDEGRIIAVDAAGNAYATGYSHPEAVDSPGDYLTIKYSAGGQQLWTARYNGPGNDFDYPEATAVDAGGNVYVTGLSTGTASGTDYATIKYSPAGLRQWVARYNGPANQADAARDVAVDAVGNVYVTGSSMGVSSGNDYATVKYAPNGAELWADRYNGTGNGSDEAEAIAVDAAGNAYVAGFSTAPDFASGLDFVTLKYASSTTPCSPTAQQPMAAPDEFTTLCGPLTFTAAQLLSNDTYPGGRPCK
ncbi:SBBP repeat-containing protein [Hymenobacter humi]|uniref:SBBP repeat-containing protein n=1 Tax=Hymenobacter humi TaxID=1411620 RepID=A0ABW2UF38_9BACT